MFWNKTKERLDSLESMQKIMMSDCLKLKHKYVELDTEIQTLKVRLDSCEQDKDKWIVLDDHAKRLDAFAEAITKDRTDLNAVINYVRNYIKKKGAK